MTIGAQLTPLLGDYSTVLQFYYTTEDASTEYVVSGIKGEASSGPELPSVLLLLI